MFMANRMAAKEKDLMVNWFDGGSDAVSTTFPQVSVHS